MNVGSSGPGEKPRRPARPKGRGAVTNPTGRFESEKRVAPLPDEMGPDERFALHDPRAPEPPDDGTLPPRTIVSLDASRTILARNDSPDVPFDVSINPYRGCEHGCIYCFARPSHAYLGFSPGLDFETRIVAKPEAPALLRAALARPGYRCRAIALGSNTDPYQPVEREMRITRRLLELLRETHHPVSVVTKSSLVLRDLDLLVPMAEEGLASVFVSLTTLDRELARRMEPRAAAPERRLHTLRALAEAGVRTGVLASPMIPGLNDAELDRILEAAARAGARTAGYILLRLPHELRRLFEEWLEANYPERRRRVLTLVRETRGGRLNDPAFGTRMRGTGPYAELLKRRFEVAARRHGLDRALPSLDIGRFRPPEREAPGGEDDAQTTLF
jgi:DNA repair photolyase